MFLFMVPYGCILHSLEIWVYPDLSEVTKIWSRLNYLLICFFDSDNLRKQKNLVIVKTSVVGLNKIRMKIYKLIKFILFEYL